MEAKLALDFSLQRGVTLDGALAWLSRDAAGGLSGTIVRYYVRGVDLVDVEEQTSGSGGPPNGKPIRVAVGKGYLDSDLGAAQLSIVLPNDVTVVMRSGSADLLRVMADGSRLTRR
jgi:hypothetical protein